MLERKNHIAKNLKNISLVLLVLSISTIFLQAQKGIEFRKLKKEDGLSSNKVYATVKDHQGFIWIATANGLNRYDSHDFKTYLASDTLTISNNQVKNLYADSKGFLWIATDGGGLCRYDYKTEQFKTFQHKATDSTSLIHNQVLTVLEDSQARLWVGTEGGLSLFDYKTESFVSYIHDPADSLSLSTGGVLSIMEDRQGRIWIGTWDGGLNLLLPKEYISSNLTIGFLHIKKKDRDLFGLSHDAIWSMKEDGKGRLWFGTFGGGLNLLVNPPDNFYNTPSSQFQFVNFSRNQDKPFSITGNKIYSIEQRENFLWIGTPYGLSILDLNDVQDDSSIQQLQQQSQEIEFVNYSNEESSTDVINGKQIIDIYKDDDGIMWLSTQKGLSVYATTEKKLSTYHRKFNDESYTLVSAFLEDKAQRLWIGTSSVGLAEYNEEEDTSVPRYITANSGEEISEITSLMQDNQGIIWIGCRNGIFTLNPETRQFNRYNHPEISTKIVVRKIEEDSKGRIWIATLGAGLIVIENKKAITYLNDPQDSNSIGNNNIRDVVEDVNGTIWIATDGAGIRKIVEGKNGRYSFKGFHGQNKSTDPPVSLVNGLNATKDGLWIGSDNQVLKYHFEKDTFFYFPKISEQVSSVNRIITDDEDFLWIASNDGLFRYDEKKDQLSQFRGQVSKETDYFIESIYKDDSGRTYLGGAFGFHAFYASDVAIDSIVIIPQITNLKLDNKSVKINLIDPLLQESILTRPISLTDHISLSHKHQLIRLEYAVVDFRNRHDYQYEYKLEGFDSQWNLEEEEAGVTYMNLKPGDYVFKIRAKNSDGYWSEPRSLEITIVTPFWMTKWFVALCILMLLGLPLLFVKIKSYQSGKIRLSLEEKVKNRTQEMQIAKQDAEKANEAKSIFLASMSHEIRTPMNSMLGTLELLNFTKLNQEQKTYIETIQQSGENLLHIINAILDFTKIESEKLELENLSFDLRKCIEEVLLLFARRAHSKGLELNYALDQNVASHIQCDKTKLKQILTNLLDNALKFTEKGSIFLQVSAPSKDTLEFRLNDTGIGIPTTKLTSLFDAFTQVDASNTRKHGGSGLGLAICKGLCEAMGGYINVTSELGKGTSFQFGIQIEMPYDAESKMILPERDSKKIIIYDDSATNIASLDSMIKSLGMRLEIMNPLAKGNIPDHFDYLIYNSTLGKKALAPLSCWKEENPIAVFIASVPFGINYTDQLADFIMTSPYQYGKFISFLSNGAVPSENKKPSKTISQMTNQDFPLEILVAEDNVFNQKLILMILTKFGYTARLVENGTEAVEIVKQQNFDLIFMDVQMPQMDGLEATYEIRGLKNINQPIIVGLTANALNQDRLKCLEAGMNDHIGKPFSIERIEDVLNKIKKKENRMKIEN